MKKMRETLRRYMIADLNGSVPYLSELEYNSLLTTSGNVQRKEQKSNSNNNSNNSNDHETPPLAISLTSFRVGSVRSSYDLMM